ncbi:MAG: APC family permease [Gammaproteobacteria bacterium]|nr:APC family permease [Gammaproteobacteria bacterium]MCH9744112.1 APC family permease [Gammaproteobacteria bacterium]
MALRKDIGTMGLLFASVAGIVGSGWLFAPFFAAKAAGPASMISWCIGFALILLIALCFAEISSLIPVAGGVVHYIKLSHGFSASLIISWLNWISFVMAPAIEVQATLQYMTHYWPDLMRTTATGHPLTALGFGVAALLLAFFMIINSIGIKYVIKLNSVTVWWKLVVPVVTVITLICVHFNAHNFHSADGFAPMGIGGIFSAVTAGGIVYSFMGFRQAVVLAGEAKNPGKILPIAVIGSLAITLILYLLLQIGFIGALSPAYIAQGWSHMHLMGGAGPFVDIAAFLGVVWLVGLLYIDAVISPSGTGLIFTASTARIIYAMSVAKILPKVFNKTNRFGAPYSAVILNFLVSLIFFFPFPGWQSMVKFLAGISVLAYAVGPVSLMAFRQQLPELKRHFSVPFAKVFTYLTFVACSLIILWSGWRTVMVLCITVAIGFVFMGIHLLRQHYRRKEALSEHVGVVWLMVYVVMLAVVSYLGSFGGIQLLGTVWDVVITAVLSSIIFYFAQKTRLPNDAVQSYLELLRSS